MVALGRPNPDAQIPFLPFLAVAALVTLVRSPSLVRLLMG
jgi:prepilin signal peptidase PulO-like enzyme (type II secretory pathway)